MTSKALRVPRVLPAFLAAVSLLGVHACAPAAAPVVSAGGRLRVANASGEPLEVFAGGSRVLLRLEDGAGASVDRLPLGDLPVEARGLRTGWRLGATVRLDAGAEAAWNVRGTEAHLAALKALPTGRVRVVNRSPEPVRAFLDGATKDLVWPGGDAEYGDLVPGTVRVRAEGTQTGFAGETVLEVAPGSVAVFEVQAPQSALRVTNRAGTPAWISVRGEPDQRVADGVAAVFPGLAPGARDVVARDEVGRTLWAGRVDLVLGRVAEAVVPAPTGELSVLSEAKVPVSILADGNALGLCAAGGAAQFAGLPGGVVRVRAVDPEGGLVARAVLTVRNDGTTLWMVRPGESAERTGDEGSLAVENRTGEALRLRVDGADRGDVPQGGRRVVPDLPPGPRAVAVAGLRSGDVLRATVEVPPGGTATWAARPRSSTLALRNARTEEVRVLVDGVMTARLAAAQTVEVPLTAGTHVVDAVGVTSLRATTHRLDLPPATVTDLVLPSPTATLIVTNRYGEPLTLSDGGRRLGVVLPGDRVTLRDVDPGRHVLEARSLDKPLSWHVQVAVAPGETFSWDLGN